jgi:FKBP-type peptidyl-prolyl cis-trans isomerase
MKGKILLIGGVLLAAVCITSQGGAQESLSLKTDRQRVSYGVGVQLAKDLQSRGIRADIGTASGTQGDEVEFELVVRGMRDALSGKPFLVSDRELRRILITYQSDLRRKQIRTGMIPSEVNKRDGEGFLVTNKGKEGVVTLPSGLQYEIVKAAGDGPKPSDTDSVQVIWQGFHLDGTDIESAKPGQARTVKVKGDAIPGIAEALKLMSVGSKWRLFVPSPLAYGEQGNGGPVGPNETLIYEVELVAIK